MLKYGATHLSIGVVEEKGEKLALYFYKEIKKKVSYDVSRERAEWETVDMSSLKNSDDREVRAEWLCKQAFRQLGIGAFLQQEGWAEDKVLLDQRFKESIQNIFAGIGKKGGTKKLDKVYQRIAV